MLHLTSIHKLARKTNVSVRVVVVPRENGSRMNDWIRNRIIFGLFYSIYKKIQNS